VPSAPEQSERRRVIVEPGGPVLVEGPVEVVLPDGSTVACDRFMVAICACRRSKRYPLCDTSHRRKARSDGSRQDGRESLSESMP
jgi:CDGSH-type Zn-finger protein